MEPDPELLFEAVTLGPQGTCYSGALESHHDGKASGHGREDVVRATLESPEQVRQIRSDSEVLLFYRAEKSSRWVCAVAKRAADQGFLITAYPTDAIKEGIQIWPK